MRWSAPCNTLPSARSPPPPELGARLPVRHVLREVDLLRGPEGRLVLLVHLPDLRVLQREHDPALPGHGKKSTVAYVENGAYRGNMTKRWLIRENTENCGGFEECPLKIDL